MSAIISMTTIPSRLPHIGPCVKSLLQQGLPVYVWIPQKVVRTGDVFDGHIPGFLGGCEVEIVEDRGSATKLLPALDIADTIITADDDVVYGRGWANNLVMWHQHSQLVDTALGYRGRVFQRESREYNNTALLVAKKYLLEVDIITGTWGALYDADWFGDGLAAEVEAYRWNDDLVINKHLEDRGIDRVLVPIPNGCTIMPLDGVHQIDSLWAENQQRNDTGLEAVGWWA